MDGKSFTFSFTDPGYVAVIGELVCMYHIENRICFKDVCLFEIENRSWLHEVFPRPVLYIDRGCYFYICIHDQQHTGSIVCVLMPKMLT